MSTAIALGERFELLSRVGAGAFGEVWKALDRKTGQTVAVKRLHAHLAEETAQARFVREAEMLAKVSSPYVVRYVDHGVDRDGRLWMAIEWLDGEDLQKFRSRAGLTLEDGLFVVRDAARGAAVLHAQGVVHRDLKPGNIFVLGDAQGGWSVKLMDLGIAHIADATALTASGMILGSPAYMAPEQVRGDRIDARVDVWALGVLLFELLAGDTPFGSTNAIAVLGKVLLEPVPPLAAVRDGLPPELSDLLERALEKNAELRLSSAETLASTIDALLQTRSAFLRGPLVVPVRRVQAVSDRPSDGAHGRGERRLVALLLARGGVDFETVLGKWGGHPERLREAWLGAFGLTRARGDELVSAARAALELARSGARVSLVSGWVEVREGRALTGPLIEQAATLVGRAGEGSVLLPRDSMGRLEGSFAFEPAGNDLRLVRERRAGQAWLHAGPPLLLGKPVRALGRDKELLLLEGVYRESVSEQSARAALVVGDPGLGKSRLLFELCSRLRAEDPPPFLVVLRAEPMLSGVPWALLSRVLREAADFEGGEEPSVAWNKLRLWLDQWGPFPAEDLEFLSELLGLNREREPCVAVRAARLEPALMRAGMRAALAHVVEKIAARMPVLLALEDLQWADAPTVELLGELFHLWNELPVTLLAFARPEVLERHGSFWADVDRTELRLAPLSQRASEQLVSSVLSLPDQERKALAQRAAGNPLFLEELVRARAKGVQELPVAVHAVLQVRLDALSTEARRLAQAASIFGQTFWLEGAMALLSLGDSASAIAELERSEVAVRRTGSRYANTTEFAFHHALLRDAANAMLVESERKELHARAAAWLEKSGETDPALIAQHYFAGERTVSAARYFASAAARALGESAFDAAELYATRALESHPESAFAGEWLLLRAEARRALGRVVGMFADARAAKERAPEDPALQIKALSRVAEAQHALGELSEADATLRAVLEESHASLLSARVQALLQLAFVDLDAGRANEAAELADEGLAWLANAGRGYEYQELLAVRARAQALAAVGDLSGALTLAEEALSAGQASGHRARAADAAATAGLIRLQLGAHELAQKELEGALAEAKALGALQLQAWVLHLLGMCASAQERWTEAKAQQEQARLLAERIPVQRVALASRLRCLLDALEEGNTAANLHTEAEDLAAVVGAFAPLRCGVLAVLSRIRLRCEDGEGALRAAEQAAELLRTTSAVEWEELVRIAQWEALSAAGKQREAETLLHTSRERLLRKAAKLRDVKAREQYLTGVREHRMLLSLAKTHLGEK